MTKAALTHAMILTGSLALLAACATPVAGPNAGATAANPPVLESHPSVGQEVGALAENKVEVIFPVGGAVLTPAADRQLDLAARLYRDANPVAMFTSGYSDHSGDEYSNLLLSAKRAQAVKRGLVARGDPRGTAADPRAR